MSKEFKTFLEGKITEDNSLFDTWDHMYSVPHLPSAATGTPFWLKREYARMRLEVYPQSTAVIDAVNIDFPWLAVHVSKEDKAAVAYTLDRQGGEQDRQVRTSIGRLLNKVYPYVAESHLAKLAEEHMAEINAEFIELRGKEITDAYAVEKAVGACMSKEAGAYTLTMGHHPTEAYWTDKISMAVLKDGNGAIIARSMIVRQSDTDWRWIRSYGQKARIEKILTRAGFKCGGWNDVVFNTIDITPERSKSESHRYILPYLDGNGVPGSDETSAVAIIDGKLTGITAEKRADYRSIATVAATTALGTGGVVDLLTLDPADFEETCAISGAKWSKLGPKRETVRIFHMEEGSFAHRIALQSALTPEYVLVHDPAFNNVYSNEPTFRYDRRLIVDTPFTRSQYGFVKLDAGLYPNQQDWVRNHDTIVAQGLRILTVDSVRFVDADHNTDYVHKANAKTMKLVPISARNGVSLAHPDCKVVRSISKRKVIIGFHDVQEIWGTGEVDYERNLKTLTYFSETVWLPKGKTEPELQQRVMEYCFSIRMGAYFRVYPVEEAGARFLESHLTVNYLNENKTMRRRPSQMVGQVDWDEIVAGVRRYWKDASYYADERALSLVNKWVTYQLAEMSALDYSTVGLQGSADGGWVPPPEPVDEFGLQAKDHLVLQALESSYASWQTMARHFYGRKGFIESFSAAILEHHKTKFLKPRLEEKKAWLAHTLGSLWDNANPTATAAQRGVEEAVMPEQASLPATIEQASLPATIEQASLPDTVELASLPTNQVVYTGGMVPSTSTSTGPWPFSQGSTSVMTGGTATPAWGTTLPTTTV